MVLLYFISVLQVVGLKCVFYVLQSHKCQFDTLYFLSLSLVMEKGKNTTPQIKILVYVNSNNNNNTLKLEHS